MKTIIPASITTREEAEKLLTDLINNGEVWHPEDSARDCISHLASVEECKKLDELMCQIYDIKGFDPCEFILSKLDLF